MRVLVTGGAGYIGSVVTDELLAAGHDVVVFDNLAKGHRDAVAPAATFIHGDLRDPAGIAAIVASRCDAVVHMAASSLVGESMVAPGAYYANNVMATMHLLDGMVRGTARALVFSSTAAVYGEPDRQPIDEDAPTVPSNPYGETKLAVERMLRWYSRAHGVGSVSLRYFNAAGATALRGERHDPETHLIPLVLAAAADPAARVTVFGDDYPTRDGTCVRDYVHVSDLAKAHVLALEALAAGRLECASFNLGCGGGFTVREVIEAARRVTGRSIAVDVAARRAGDPAVLVATSARIREALGWSPEFADLDAIVGSAWSWMRTRG
jgi:UDP-glucose 4-epimerase